MRQSWELIAGFVQKIWPAAGPLIGIFIGSWLTRSGDRKKWMNDNRKEEYRELLTALTNATTSLLGAYQNSLFFVDEKEKLEATEQYTNSLKVIQDRIFIAAEIGNMKLFDRWGEAVKSIQTTGKIREFEDQFEILKKEIVGRATKV
jgi:hypothetical protein